MLSDASRSLPPTSEANNHAFTSVVGVYGQALAP